MPSAYMPGITSRIPSSAATNNATSGKVGEGFLSGFSGYNTNAAVRYLKFYDKASAPTVGTDVPVLTYALPPTTAFAIPAFDYHFKLGLAYALVTGAADNDNTAVGAGDILGLNILMV